MRQAVATEDAPAAVGPYSQAIACDGWLYVSGQIALDPATGQAVGEDGPGQVAQALANLHAILRAAGVGPEAVVKTTLYLVDLAEFPAVNRVYGEFFQTHCPAGTPPPARATVGVAALPLGVRVELDAIARMPG
jgi:2-iminobutanoate/2-iminopropanoate deaminase